jgi:hypothetical protein
MKPAAAISLPFLILAMVLPLHAQHGHAGGGGFHSGGSVHAGGGFSGGGFASHAAPSFHNSFNGARGIRPVSPGRFAPQARFGNPARMQSARPYLPSSNLRAYNPGNLRPSPGVRRPEYNVRGPQDGAHRPVYGDRDHHHRHRPAYNYGGTTIYTGTVLPYGFYNSYGYGYGDLGFPYDDSYDDSGYDNSDADSPAYSNPAYDDSNNYVAESAPEAAAPQYPGQADSTYNYGSPRPQASAAQPSASPLPQESVTLIFNNGVPSQQIHNYILSRSTLIILDGPRREIPVADLDLEATRKANRASGVDFNLPN